MAKKQKYSDDLLLEAVVKYAEVERNKIKATELAKWCRENIEGLEEVRDYHFTRTIRERDKKTGVIKERPKQCTVRIEEINKARDLTQRIKTNLLLRANNIDSFFSQSVSAQRKMIVETRETIHQLQGKYALYARENEVFRIENKALKNRIIEEEDKIVEIQKKQAILEKQINYLMKKTDENERKSILAEMGLKDGEVDLEQYNKSLRQDISKLMDINDVLRRHLVRYSQVESEDTPLEEMNQKDKESETLKDEVLSGIEF